MQKLHKSIYVYYNQVCNKEFIFSNEYLGICFHLLNLLELHGKLKNKEERYKAAKLLLYFYGWEACEDYAKLLTNAKDVYSDDPFCLSKARDIYNNVSSR